MFAGIDLGGTNIKAALADDAGEIIALKSIDTKRELPSRQVLDRCADLIKSLQEQHSVTNLRCVGVGVPGLVDRDQQSAQFLPNFPGFWRDVPIRTYLRSSLNCEVRVLNDARAAALGELYFGHGSGMPGMTFALFTLGTGIGGGVVIDGKLRLGPIGAAGELGHQTIVADGPLCGCGNRGCIEAIASGSALVRDASEIMTEGNSPALARITDNEPSNISVETIFEAADSGDAAIGKMLDHAFECLGIAVANVVTILHCDMIIFGGGMAGLGDRLLNPIRNVIESRVKMFPTDEVTVQISKLGSTAGVRGAVALAMKGV